MRSPVVPSGHILTYCESLNSHPLRVLRNSTRLGLIVFALWLLTGCGLQQQVRPDWRIPHQVAQPVDVVIWASPVAGKSIPITVTIPTGWWIASDQLISPLP